MCGRFTLTEFSGFDERWGIDSSDLTPRYNIAPSQEVPVIINDGKNHIEMFRWGLIPYWAKDPAIGSKMINARAESLEEKPSFKMCFQRQRCAILADGFYEWKKEGAIRRPYLITLNDRQPFLFAGLWDTWNSPKGELIHSCAIITITSNELMEPIHSRMPVILPRAFEQVWLSPNITESHLLREVLKPFPADQMTAYEVTPVVNSPKNDGPHCLEPRISLF